MKGDDMVRVLTVLILSVCLCGSPALTFESSDFSEHLSSLVDRAFLLRYLLRLVAKGAEKVDDWS